MEENVQELLKDKNENVVQFNFTNSTSNPISVDLFNSATLSQIPTSVGNANPTYPIGNVAVFSAGQYRQVYNPNNNSIYLLDLTTQNINVYNISNQSVIFIPLPTINCFDLSFCPINNSIYVTDFNTGSPIVIVDCTLNVVSGTIIVNVNDELSFIEYNSNNNTMYIGVGRFATAINFIYFLDCSTNTLTSSTTLPYITSAINFSDVTSSNFIYFTYNTNIRKIDCSTNLITGVSIPVLSFTTNNIVFNSNNNFLYGTLNGSTSIFVINTNTDTLLFNLTTTSITPNSSNNCLQLNTITNQLFAGLFNNNYDVFNCDSNTYIQTNQVATTGFLFDIIFIQSTETLWITDSNTFLTPISTQYSVTPFYVIGSTNYNSFVNNLNNEPIEIQLIRLVTQSQNQLTNQLQLTTIDSNGNQIFMPNFPINEVSAFQQQGNIGEVPFKDIIFDGRTYINQYQLNPNETTSFEIYYKQLDLTSATFTFPIFFKPKIQLKEYIKNELNL